MTDPQILSDTDLEAMLARRAGNGIPDGLAAAIDAALAAQVERRSWLSLLVPPARGTRPLRVAWVVAIVGLLVAAAVSAVLVGTELLRRANELTVVPPPSVMPAPSVAPTANPVPTAAPAAQATRPISQVNGIAFAADGSLWLATGGGVIHWDVLTSTATLYGQNAGLPTTAAMRVEVAPDGTIWAAGSSSQGWLAQFDGGWTVYSSPADLDGLEIVDFGGMAIGGDGRVWAAFGSTSALPKLLRFDGTWTAIDVPESVTGGATPWGFALTVAPDGTLWADAPMNGITAFDGATWRSYSKASTGLPRTPSLAGIGRDGSVWVTLTAEGCTTWSGCDVPAAGVARLDGTGWTVYTSANGLVDDDANLLVGPGGDIWVTYASRPGTVSRFDGRHWFTTQAPDLATATGLAVAPDGALWLDATGGFLRFDGSTVTNHPLPAMEVPSELPLLQLTIASGPTTTASAFGTISWKVYESPSEYYLRAVGTPYGPVALDGPDLRWLTASGSWAGTTLPIEPWQATAAGDRVIVHRVTAVPLSWNGSRWVPGHALDLPDSLGNIYRVATGPRGTVLGGPSSVAWSTDGQHFADAIRGPIGPTSEATGVDAMNTVAIGPVFATQDGFVALVPGQRVSWGGPFPEPVPWFSTDGSTWEPTASASPFGAGTSVSDVASRDGRYVAVGTEGAVWVSDDGLSWERVASLVSRESCEPLTCSGQLVEVDAAEFGWMALNRDGVAWTSSDGTTWDLLRDWPRVRGGWATPTLSLGAGTIVVTGLAVDRTPGATGPSAVIAVGTVEP